MSRKSSTENPDRKSGTCRRIKVVNIQKVGDSATGYSMSMRIVTKSRGSENTKARKIHAPLDKEKRRSIDIKSESLARIRDWSSRIARKGEKCWLYTFTYARAEHSPRVAVSDLRNICLYGDTIDSKVMGVWELHSNSRGGGLGHGLHLHVISSKSLAGYNWSKGRWSEKAVNYNAVSAENYLSKQWREGDEYLVKWRGEVKCVSGLSEYRKLWKNVQHCVCNRVLKESPVVSSQSQQALSKGELFAVFLEDLKCLSLLERNSVNYLERANCLSLRRSANGTLFASNNSEKPSKLMRWLLKNRKSMVIEIYEKAHKELSKQWKLENYIEL